MDHTVVLMGSMDTSTAKSSLGKLLGNSETEPFPTRCKNFSTSLEGVTLRVVDSGELGDPRQEGRDVLKIFRRLRREKVDAFILVAPREMALVLQEALRFYGGEAALERSVLVLSGGSGAEAEDEESWTARQLCIETLVDSQLDTQQESVDSGEEKMKKMLMELIGEEDSIDLEASLAAAEEWLQESELVAWKLSQPWQCLAVECIEQVALGRKSRAEGVDELAGLRSQSEHRKDMEKRDLHQKNLRRQLLINLGPPGLAISNLLVVWKFAQIEDSYQSAWAWAVAFTARHVLLLTSLITLVTHFRRWLRGPPKGAEMGED